MKRAAVAVVLGLSTWGLPNVQAQITGVNSTAIGLRYYADIPASTVSVTQNSFPSVLQFQESFPVRPASAGGTSRHVGILSSDAGVTPYVIPSSRPWSFGATVRMDGDASQEVGLHIGALGPVSPWNFGANTGQLMVNGATREIAAFGGWLPFFSSFRPQWSNIGLADRGREFVLGIRVVPISPTSVTAEYFVNGVGTGPLALDAGAVSAYYSQAQSAGVYAQNTWQPTGPSSATSTFTNLVIPAPGVSCVLALSSMAMAIRRRRR